MDALLKELVGFISQYLLEIVLWLAVLVMVVATWYMLWPIQQPVIAGAITVAGIGAIASAQSSIVALLKSTKKSRRKK